MVKKIIENIVKIFIFIALVNLPFITITQLVGMDTFLDSFDNPNSYQYFKTNKLDIPNQGYMILQKTSHPDFSIIKGDTIFYLKDEGGLMCRKIYHISDRTSMKKYYITNFDDEIDINPIYEYQIVGKVVNTIDNNIWNKFSIEIWDASINNLNAVALFAK